VAQGYAFFAGTCGTFVISAARPLRRGLRRVDPQTGGREPWMQIERQTARFERGVPVHQVPSLIHRLEFENQHAAQVAVIAEWTRDDQLARLRQFLEVRQMPPDAPSCMRRVSSVCSAVQFGPLWKKPTT